MCKIVSAFWEYKKRKLPYKRRNVFSFKKKKNKHRKHSFKLKVSSTSQSSNLNSIQSFPLELRNYDIQIEDSVNSGNILHLRVT